MVLIGHIHHVGAAAVILDGDGLLSGVQLSHSRRKPRGRAGPVNVARLPDGLAAETENGLPQDALSIQGPSFKVRMARLADWLSSQPKEGLMQLCPR